MYHLLSVLLSNLSLAIGKDLTKLSFSYQDFHNLVLLIKYHYKSQWYFVDLSIFVVVLGRVLVVGHKSIFVKPTNGEQNYSC